MSEYVKRIMPFGSCDILETQHWLEEMSAKGLHYVSSGYFFAKFRKGEPKQMRYRLDFCDVIAGDIPEEKREMYEATGWEVIGDYKNDSVVVCTDDPEAVEVYAEPERFVKPLKRMGATLLEVCAVLAVMLLAVLWYEFGMHDGFVGALLANSTLQFALLTVVEVILLFQLLCCFAQWLRVRKAAAMASAGELMHSRGKSFGYAAKLAVPAVLICAAAYAITLFGGSMPDETMDISSLPFPSGEEFGWSFDSGKDHTTLSHTAGGDSIHCFRYGEVTYIVDYYDLCAPVLARQMADKIVHDRDLADFAGDSKIYTDEYDGVRVFYIRNAASGEFNTQMLYIQCGSRFIRVLCESTDVDFGSREVCKQYIDALKSAK